jgi:hypothetical protein
VGQDKLDEYTLEKNARATKVDGVYRHYRKRNDLMRIEA